MAAYDDDGIFHDQSKVNLPSDYLNILSAQHAPRARTDCTIHLSRQVARIARTLVLVLEYNQVD